MVACPGGARLSGAETLWRRLCLERFWLFSELQKQMPPGSCTLTYQKLFNAHAKLEGARTARAVEGDEEVTPEMLARFQEDCDARKPGYASDTDARLPLLSAFRRLRARGVPEKYLTN